MSAVNHFFEQEQRRLKALAEAIVTPDSIRCVQCGICSYNCPVGIDVRSFAWRETAVADHRCIRCGECIARCPRHVLHFESARK